MDSLVKEMVDYRSNLIDLYNEVYNTVKVDIQMNPCMKVPVIKNTIQYDLDKFFKGENTASEK